MITRESITIMLGGDAFSPAEAAKQTGLTFTNPVERGQIGVRGRYKGLPEPRGHANLDAPDDVPEGGKLAALLDTILPHAEVLRQLGVEDMIVYAGYFYEAQCNLTFWPDAMAKLGELGVPFWVSCYGDESDSSAMAVGPTTEGSHGQSPQSA